MSNRIPLSLIRRTPAFLAGAALLGTCALTALPAQAATIDGIQDPLVPANTTQTVEFRHGAPDSPNPSPQFPAGTYWILIDQYRWTLPLWIDGLSDKLGDATSRVEVVTLNAPGTISMDIAVGVAGTMSQIEVMPGPANAPDPSGMSEDQLVDYIVGLPNSGALDDLITMTAARVPKAAAMPDLDAHLNGAPFPEMVLEGDFLGIGVTTTAYRNGNMITVLKPDGASHTFSFGRPGDTVLVGDWDGDGQDTFGMRRGNALYLDNDLDGGIAEHTYAYGRAGDEVLVGDWDGDKKDTVAVRRGNTFYVTNNFEGGKAPIEFAYGRATDDALVGDWNGDGTDTVSILRGSMVYVKNTLTGGVADVTYKVSQ